MGKLLLLPIHKIRVFGLLNEGIVISDSPHYNIVGTLQCVYVCVCVCGAGGGGGVSVGGPHFVMCKMKSNYSSTP